MTETKSTCPYCGVGCGVVIESDNGKITGVRGDESHPANFGKLCSKGSALHLTLSPGARATFPTLRTEKNIPRERISWDTALDHAAIKFADTIAKHGPDSVAFYISGQLLTEDYYVFNKLAKGLIGTNNVDTNSRLCMSSAVAGYKATLGADAPPCAYEDIDYAECIFIVGSNTAYAHPILFRRIEAARAKNPNLKLIVADPRRTETASEADLFLQIKPGSDVALFNAMLRVMLDERLINQTYIEAHTQGFSALKETLADYAPANVAELIGVSIEGIVQAARWFATSPATLSLYCQGLNQSARGTDKNAALINLHLATQQIGKPGAGPFSLTGQPNAMGGREVGGMANLLSAHRDLANAEHRAEVAKLWGVDSVPATPGKTAVELFEALHAGSIKCVWIACTNPAQSMPDQALIREAMQRADFVVLQECYADTETAQYADLLLPASTWGEKEGTVTNSERRISRVRAAIPPPGEARHDWQIVVDFARVLVQKLNSAGSEKNGGKLFPYINAEEIFNEHRETTRGRDLDITGLSYNILESRGPQQWPFAEHANTGKVRLYEDGIFPTENGRAKFANTKFLPVAEATTAKFPISLNTGRLRDQWHGMSRTGRAAQLYAHAPEPILTMNLQTLIDLGIGHHDFVTITSARGALTIPVEASADVAINEAFLPMHWGSRFVKGNGINALTVSAFDPISRQPELKHAAVSIERADLPWRLVAMAETANANTLLAKLVMHFDGFEYATCGLAGRDHDVVVFRAAAKKAVPQNVIDKLDALFGIDEAALQLSDAASSITRAIKIDHGKLIAMRLAGDITGQEWLGEWLESRVDIGALGYRALAGGSTPPLGAATRGRIVCACHNVAHNEITACFNAGGSVADAQKKLKCGTGCGSCLPEVRRIELKIRVQATDENSALEELAA
jgi:assimilatory nitrate reductase catalytic subunit